MKALYSMIVVILLIGCQNARQKAIQTICKEVGKNSNCTKTVGLISASVVENQFKHQANPPKESDAFPSLIEAQDSFSW